jgi:lysyl-tRNA synthetase class I
MQTIIMEKDEKAELFWADKIAKKILERKQYHYIDKKVPKFEVYTAKSAASLSGVLHIGRLSDVLRHISVHRALVDAGANLGC